MHYELWGLHPANLIARPRTEAEAFKLVRELLAAGWKAEDLSLGLEPDEGEPDDLELPDPIQGAQLAAQALVFA